MGSLLLLDWSYPYRFYVKDLLKEYCDKFYVVAPNYIKDFGDLTDYLIIPDLYQTECIEDNVDAICDFVEKNKIDYIFNTEEELVVLEHSLKAKLGLNHSLSTAKILQNKLSVRQALDDNSKLNAPRYEVVRGDSRKELMNGLKNIGFPSIIKPLNSNFSSGVTLVENLEDVKLALEAIDLEVGNNTNTYNVLVEEVISLNEKMVSVEVFVQDKKLKCILFTDENQYMHTRKNKSKTFYYDNVLIGNNYSSEDKYELTGMVEEIINVFNISDLTLHIEFKKNEDGLWNLVEINPRLCGGPIAYAHYLGSGINAVAVSFKISNNISLESSDTSRKYDCKSIITFFNENLKEGVIRKINIDVSAEINYIDKIIFYFQKGDYYESSPTGLGFTIISGSYSVENIQLLSNIVKKKIGVTYDE